MNVEQLIGADKAGNVVCYADRNGKGPSWWCVCGMDRHAEPSRAGAADWLCQHGAFRVIGVHEPLAGRYTVIC